MANGYSSDNTSDEHCAGGSSGGLIRLQGDQVIHPGFPYYAQSLWLHQRITSSSMCIIIYLSSSICIIIYLILQIILNQEPRSPGAHDSERATFMRSCHGVFTDWFVFKTVLARILIIF